MVQTEHISILLHFTSLLVIWTSIHEHSCMIFPLKMTQSFFTLSKKKKKNVDVIVVEISVKGLCC